MEISRISFGMGRDSTFLRKTVFIVGVETWSELRLRYMLIGIKPPTRASSKIIKSMARGKKHTRMENSTKAIS